MAAPMTITVKLDTAAFQAAMARVRSIPGGFRRIVPPALNRALRSTRTLMDRQLRTKLAVKKKSVMQRMTTKKAGSIDASASIRLAPTRFALASFKGVRQTRRGVTYTIAPGKRKRLDRGFITAGFSNAARGQRVTSKTVWRRAMRQDKAFRRGIATAAGDIVQRMPLVVPKGPSLAAVWTKQRGMVRQVERRVPQMIVREIYSRIAYVTRGRR